MKPYGIVPKWWITFLYAWGIPVFDLVFLGMGDDGHTASIFPGNGELLTTVASCVATRNPHTGQQRLTVTGQPLILSGEICFLVTGEKKSHIVGEVIGNPECCPASYVAHCGNHVSFFLDKSAAKKLLPDPSFSCLDNCL
ncbi:MAG: 6-phosphogluconolactonase [Bacteroides sp.]|nr:6-phosphogluconolactonase [Bacteroides sp.]